MREDSSKLFVVLIVAIVGIVSMFVVYNSTRSGEVSFGSNAKNDFFGKVIDALTPEKVNVVNDSLGGSDGDRKSTRLNSSH